MGRAQALNVSAPRRPGRAGLHEETSGSRPAGSTILVGVAPLLVLTILVGIAPRQV